MAEANAARGRILIPRLTRGCRYHMGVTCFGTETAMYTLVVSTGSWKPLHVCRCVLFALNCLPSTNMEAFARM